MSRGERLESKFTFLTGQGLRTDFSGQSWSRLTWTVLRSSFPSTMRVPVSAIPSVEVGRCESWPARRIRERRERRRADRCPSECHAAVPLGSARSRGLVAVGLREGEPDRLAAAHVAGGRLRRSDPRAARVAEDAVSWLRCLRVVFVIGIVLSPLRPAAATVPTTPARRSLFRRLHGTSSASDSILMRGWCAKERRSSSVPRMRVFSCNVGYD